jgi:hypothetical protein
MKTKHPPFPPGPKAFWPIRLKKSRTLILIFFLLLILLFLKLTSFKISLYQPEDEARIGIVLILDRLFVFAQKGLVWQSDPSWQVKDFFISDLNQDRQEELNLIVFSQKRYGDHRPFWVKKDQEFSNHFFIFRLSSKEVVPIWQSSRIEKPICQAEGKDLDRDGHQELVVKEGEYTQKSYSCQKTTQTSWQWNGWGFTKLD